MEKNNFIWVDLSTYDLKKAENFYSTVLDWDYNSWDSEYLTAFNKNTEISGLYSMPKKFEEMNMPSFWMSYIEVASIEETLKKARQIGARIEFIEHNEEVGSYALIRDALGAGFMIYENSLLHLCNVQTNFQNELYISDISKIKPFYEYLFNWDIEKISENKYAIKNENGDQFSTIWELNNKIKSDYEYWAVRFYSHKTIQELKPLIIENGGEIALQENDNSLWVNDPSGAFFILQCA